MRRERRSGAGRRGGVSSRERAKRSSYGVLRGAGGFCLSSSGALAVAGEVHGIDVLLDGQHGVQEALHLGGAVVELVAPEALGVDRGGLQHLSVGLLEVGVVAEEVAVGQDVGHHELVLQGGVGLHQEGVAGVGVDHQLVDLGEAVVVHRLHLVVRPAVGPVGEAPGEPVGAELVHDGGGDDLEVGGVGVEPEGEGLVPDALDPGFELHQGRIAADHFHGEPRGGLGGASGTWEGFRQGFRQGFRGFRRLRGGRRSGAGRGRPRPCCGSRRG